MKVLFINEECGTGSTGRICSDIASALENQGHEVKIAYGRNDDVIPERFRKYAVRIGSSSDLMLHGLKARLLDASGFGSTAATKKFIEWMKEFDPDVIHLHNIHGYYINIELLFDYLKSCSKRIIWTLHDVWAFTGHSAYCDAVQCEKWTDGCGNCPQLGVYPKSYIDRSKHNWIKKKRIFTDVPDMNIVTPSYWLADLVKKSFLCGYPVSVINNGVDTEVFHPLKSDFKERHGLSGKKIILSAATVWNDLKGYGDFLKLAGMLDKKYQIVLVGSFDKLNKTRLPGNILHIEHTRNIDEMAELYNAADAYANLTYCDTYPTVNLEAAACGTPVITYDVGGSTESAVEFGGVSVKRGDLDAVVKALNTLEKRSFVINDKYKLDKKNAVENYIRRIEGKEI